MSERIPDEVTDGGVIEALSPLLHVDADGRMSIDVPDEKARIALLARLLKWLPTWSAKTHALVAAGSCEACGTFVGDAALVIDHDHNTDTFRGLLCGNCNKGLGLFCDSPERLRRAAEYLERVAGAPRFARRTREDEGRDVATGWGCGDLRGASRERAVHVCPGLWWDASLRLAHIKLSAPAEDGGRRQLRRSVYAESRTDAIAALVDARAELAGRGKRSA